MCQAWATLAWKHSARALRPATNVGFIVFIVFGFVALFVFVPRQPFDPVGTRREPSNPTTIRGIWFWFSRRTCFDKERQGGEFSFRRRDDQMGESLKASGNPPQLERCCHSNWDQNRHGTTQRLNMPGGTFQKNCRPRCPDRQQPQNAGSLPLGNAGFTHGFAGRFFIWILTNASLPAR
jgi:hypothetical protein